MTTASSPVTPDTTRDRAPGQIIIMFALFSTAMFGVLGLATDLGFAFAQRRSMQNAADAAALAGARAIAKWTADNNLAARPEVEAMVAANGMGGATPEVVSCSYVDYGNTPVGGCEAPVPEAARGVRVRVREQHEPFFIGVVPGAPEQVTTEAVATAHVHRPKTPPAGPFIICGSNAWAVADAAGQDLTTGGWVGREYDILLADGTVNPDYVGWTFRVFDNNLTNNTNIERREAQEQAGCGLEQWDASWNGLAADGGEANAGSSVPGWFDVVGGTHLGSVRETVAGIEGCEEGTNLEDDDLNCIALLPVAQRVSPAIRDQLYVVGYAPFRLTWTRSSSDAINATLLAGYVVSGPSEATWCRTCGGTAIIRLTE